MFKSIEYIKYDRLTDSYIYKLVDTHFECEAPRPTSSAVDASVSASANGLVMVMAAFSIAEYKKRNYSSYQISKNLFRCNLYLCNKYKYSFEEILKWQHKYMDIYFKDINFSKLYYQDIKDMWDKYKVFH